LFSGAAAGILLLIAVFPPRLGTVMRGWDSLPNKTLRALGGLTLDLSAVILILAPLVLALTLLIPAIVSAARRRTWQRFGALGVTFPVAFGLWLLSVIAEQVKSERGAFPTMFDLIEGGSNASFVEGAVGFIRYDRIWIPALVGCALISVLFALCVRAARRGVAELLPWSGWALGLVFSLGILTAVVSASAGGLGAVSNRFSAAALGDPLTGLVESSMDLLMQRGQSTPRELVLQANLPGDLAVTGAARIGWPPLKPAEAGAPCWPHPHARPLDFEAEPAAGDPRGRALLQALAQLSQLLFESNDAKVAVFQLSLESFRGDDVHALNPAAPKEIDPFTTQLYESAQRGGEGVLASSKMFQAGVRTAQGLGALTCGVGTLPYNLSFIRDLSPFPMRCASDLLSDAGFRGWFFYGSDASFDDMHGFLKGHGISQVISQSELPAGLPKGAWDGVTDFALFDEATKRVAAGLTESAAPQYALVMSLSNHSPFGPPEDLPPPVIERVDRGLNSAINRADADDRRRLMTHSYTDAALERFFKRLEALHLAERSIVVLSADHSTGEDYVWGPQTVDHETDAAKARIPFAIVVPSAFLARVKDRPALDAAFKEAQARLDEAALSQNDIPMLILALLKAHPGMRGLAPAAQWHSLGGQITSPWFRPGGEASAYLFGINGVSELYALDRQGVRVGSYEDSVFLKTRADRYRVTPRLIPAAATLVETMLAPSACRSSAP
jgi:hypothetical protein